MDEENSEENLNFLCKEKRIKVLVRQILDKISVKKRNNLDCIRMLEDLKNTLTDMKNEDFLKEHVQEETSFQNLD